MSSTLSDVHYSSETGEWYTPAIWLERVCDAFGHDAQNGGKRVAHTFHLDPCGSSLAPAAKYARRMYTIADDGLSQSWTAETLFMNPPYGNKILPWVMKLDEEVKARHVSNAIALLPARTDTLWWQDYVAHYPVCFVRSRIRFEGAENSAPFPSALVCYMKDPVTFIRTFRAYGAIYLPNRLL